MFDLRAKRELNTGFSNALGKGVELALTPAIFAGIGWLVDRALGTSPLFTIGMVVFAFAGMMVRAWLGYDTEMRRHENQMLGLRKPEGEQQQQ